MNPRVDIYYDKLKHNTMKMVEKSSQVGISIAAVTKVFCGNPSIAEALIEGGVKYLADSRIENLIRMKDLPLPKILLRLPMISQAKDVVTYADISFNSEVETLRVLNESAQEINKIHRIVLMVDLGDLREGVFDELELEEMIVVLKGLSHIEVIGIGTNLTCFGGVIPSEANLNKLIQLGEKLEKALGITLEIISGGNSSSVYMLEENRLPKRINHLRLGESILLGTESAYGEELPNLYQDTFRMVAEVIEVKEKPSLPIGEIGMDAFGNKPVFEDRGVRRRAILAIGKQDIGTYSIAPSDEQIMILGGSSDHLIIDITDCERSYKVGDEVEFKLGYGALLSLMTSEYVYKNIITK